MTDHGETVHSSAVWIGLPRGGWSLIMWFHSASHMTALSGKLGWSAFMWPASAGGLPHVAVQPELLYSMAAPSKRAKALTGLKARPGTGSHFCCIPLVKAVTGRLGFRGGEIDSHLDGRTSGHVPEGKSSCQLSLETLVCSWRILPPALDTVSPYSNWRLR